MKRLITLAAFLLLIGLAAGPASASYQVFSNGQPVAVSQPGNWSPSPLLPATLIAEWNPTPEHNWSLNADFSWANAWDTSAITAPHMLTEIQYYASPTLGVEYEFLMTTDLGGTPDPANLVLLDKRTDLDGGGQWGWISIDVTAAKYTVQPGQIYWFVRRAPVGGWPGFTWSSATATNPPMNDPVMITNSYPNNWNPWVVGTNWWMMFRMYGDTSSPLVDIKCNGGDAAVQVPAGTNAKIDFNVIASTATGTPVDIWLVIGSPFGFFSYNGTGPISGWNFGLGYAYFTGPLADVNGTCLDRPLPVGGYKAHIALDTVPNGNLDLGAILLKDKVDFTVF